MFHTYVTASSGRQIDVDRAWYLMDKKLLAEAEVSSCRVCYDGEDAWKVEAARHRLSDPALLKLNVRGHSRVDVQWAIYCLLHEAKYGEPFEPDHSLSWDT